MGTTSLDNDYNQAIRHQKYKEMEQELESLKSHHELTHEIICNAQRLSPNDGKTLLYNMDQLKIRVKELEGLVLQVRSWHSDPDWDKAVEGMTLCPLMGQLDTMNGTIEEIMVSSVRSVRAASFECSKKRVETNNALQSLNQEIIEALESTVEPLKDWIETTGHGEVNRRDRAALEKVEKVLKHIKGE